MVDLPTLQLRLTEGAVGRMVAGSMKSPLLALLVVASGFLLGRGDAAKAAGPVAQEASKADTIVLPRVDCQSGGLVETKEFLRQRSVALDPEGKGLNFIIKPIPPFEVPSPGKEIVSEFTFRTVTVKLHQASIRKTASEVAKAAGGSARVDPFAVVLSV